MDDALSQLHTLDLSRVRALCFDVDGTLSDTDDMWVNRLSALLAPVKWLAPRWNPQIFARWLIIGMETPGNLLYHWLDRVHLDDELAVVYNYLAHLRRHKPPKKFAIVPGVIDMLKDLLNRYPMSVVSARDQISTNAFLTQFDLHHHFSSVVTSQTCQYTKPFPDPIIHAAKKMGVSPDECLMIGDTTVDILAGKAAGAQTVGVLCGFGKEDELRRAGADLILPTTADLIDFLYGHQS
jgi:HAD superfamily hydrolase (TIGR01509 family)